jgi:hypothetical protein
MANFDVWVNTFMAENISPFIARVADIITNIGGTAVMIILALITGLIFLYKRRWRSAAIMIISIGTTGFFVGLMKELFLRVRPENALHVIVNDPSFPSGHAAMAAAFFVASVGASLMDQYVGLHHDDTDAYLPDVPTPLKVLPEFKWFRDLEDHMQKMCYERFGCVVTDYSIIKNSDIVLLLTEKRDLMPEKNGNWQHNYTQEPIPHPYHIDPLEPVWAKQVFLHHHMFLRRALGM